MVLDASSPALCASKISPPVRRLGGSDGRGAAFPGHCGRSVMRRTAVSNTASRPSDSRLDDSLLARRLDAENVRYPGFGPGSTVLEAETQYQEGGLPLPCDIVFDRDIAV
jgi:hypothetical protein